MFIEKNSITINGISMGQYIVEAKYGYHKLWGSDSGRNLAGEQTGTIIGIFPKLTLQFRKLTKTELETLAPIFDSAVQSVTYYDPTKASYVTMETYSNDYEIINHHIINESAKNESFPVAFISVRKRA